MILAWCWPLTVLVALCAAAIIGHATYVWWDER